MIYDLKESPWFFHKHCNMVGRQCGPNSLNISESTIRGRLQMSLVYWAVSFSEILFFVKNFDPFIRESAGQFRLPNFTKKIADRQDLGNRASSGDQAHMKSPKTTGEVKSARPSPVQSLWRGDRIIAVTYPLLRLLCGANISRTLYSCERLALP